MKVLGGRRKIGSLEWMTMLVSVKIYGDIIADGTIFASLTFNSPDLLFSKSPVLSDKMPSLDIAECVKCGT